MVKYSSLTRELPSILLILSVEEVDGILGVAVKCVDIKKNTDGEGSQLVHY